MTTTTMPFSSQASAEDEGTDDGPTELEIEVEEEEESSQEKKSAAKNQVHTQEVWRELLGTLAAGGIKLLYSTLLLSSSYSSTDCL